MRRGVPGKRADHPGRSGEEGFHPARREVHHGRVPFTWKKVVPQDIRLTQHRRTFVGAKNNMHGMVLLEEVGQGSGILETRSCKGCRILENKPASRRNPGDTPAH